MRRFRQTRRRLTARVVSGRGGRLLPRMVLYSVRSSRRLARRRARVMMAAPSHHRRRAGSECSRARGRQGLATVSGVRRGLPRRVLVVIACGYDRSPRQRRGSRRATRVVAARCAEQAARTRPVHTRCSRACIAERCCRARLLPQNDRVLRTVSCCPILLDLSHCRLRLSVMTAIVVGSPAMLLIVLTPIARGAKRHVAACALTAASASPWPALSRQPPISAIFTLFQVGQLR